MTEESGKIEHPNLAEYYRRLPEVDSTNVQSLVSTLIGVLGEREIRATLKGVGGIIDKPLPRKDIDLALRLEEEGEGKISDFESDLEYSLHSFKLFRDIVKAAVSRIPSWEIEKENEPAMDEEHQNPNILKNDGTITIRPRKGTLIEIVRIPETSDRKETRPYVLLADSLKAA